MTKKNYRYKAFSPNTFFLNSYINTISTHYVNRINDKSIDIIGDSISPFEPINELKLKGAKYWHGIFQSYALHKEELVKAILELTTCSSTRMIMYSSSWGPPKYVPIKHWLNEPVQAKFQEVIEASIFQ